MLERIGSGRQSKQGISCLGGGKAHAGTKASPASSHCGAVQGGRLGRGGAPTSIVVPRRESALAPYSKKATVPCTVSGPLLVSGGSLTVHGTAAFFEHGSDAKPLRCTTVDVSAPPPRSSPSALPATVGTMMHISVEYLYSS